MQFFCTKIRIFGNSSLYLQAEKSKINEINQKKHHEILTFCITHLPQIAAMADTHFVIEKSSTEDDTITDIRCLEEEESLAELARLLGSDTLTEAALTNAREMKEQARVHKNKTDTIR